jgi:L-ascorbate metabolism protein UlaG (beta-lactamase superfamily)
MWRYMNPSRLFAATLCICVAAFAHADDAIVAKYLANAGVLISHGETKIVFDPLFDNDYGTYELVPEDLVQALFEGAPPFDGLDAVFVSHHHGDHFSPERMVALLKAHPDLLLFGPSQAIDSMPVDPTDTALQGRLQALALDLDGTFAMLLGNIEVSAVRIPHSGWPTRHADIENIAFKVSLDAAATVLHMGDAHTDPTFFDNRAEYWAEQHTHLALPPYWYFLSDGGKKILEDHIHAEEVFGVHVPKNVPDSPAQYPEELQGTTLLSVPGEEKRIPVGGNAE